MSQSLIELRLRDPLSDLARKERKILLGFSVIAIVVVKTGLVPEKIEALGISFTTAHQSALLGVLFVVILYFLGAFLIYAVNDVMAWRLAQIRAERDRAEERVNREISEGRGVLAQVQDPALAEIAVVFAQRTRWINVLLRPAVWLRVFVLELILPSLVAVYSLIILAQSW